ncbi:MAG: DUF4390 domain-containing protein [Burkholderiaceae bacterium]|jgi:hypothetical protein
MRALRNGFKRAGHLLLALTLSLTLALPIQAARDVIEANDVRLEPAESPEAGWMLSATFLVELNARLEDVVNRGVPLYFVVEFELNRPRWYWLDEQAVSATRSYRLSYHALTRQYRVSFGALQLGFATLREALDMLSHIRDWKVVERGVLKTGATYAGALRMRLDIAQMPKPFQINAITNRDWTLASEWYRFGFTPVSEVTR